MLFLTALSGLALSLRTPQATGKDVYQKSGGVVDASNSDQGYIMVKRESGKRQKLRITKDKETYDYDLSGNDSYEVFPLQMGSGKYKIEIYEQKSGSKYSSKFSKEIKVSLSDEMLPFLYPNKLINFNENTACVALSEKLCEGLTDDMEKVKAVNNYVTKNIMYDYMRALQVTGGTLTSYTPDIDDVLNKKMGICFDYSAVVACLLRAQGIPTKMVMGYADTTYHAWNSIYVNGKWQTYDATFAVTNYKPENRTPQLYY